MGSLATDKKQAPATILTNGLATIFKAMVAILPLVPAVEINLDSAAGQGETWTWVAIGFVVCGALFVQNAMTSLRDGHILSGGLWGLLGIGFVCLNIMNALGNAASHSDQSRDQKKAQIQAAATISSQRSQWSQRRDEQARIAGEATPDGIEADIQARKAGDARKWQQTEGCNPEKIKGEAARLFCKDIAGLEKKKAAATKRDELDAQLAKLNEEAKGAGEVPATVDSYADAMAGKHPGKAALYDWQR